MLDELYMNRYTAGVDRSESISGTTVPLLSAHRYLAVTSLAHAKRNHVRRTGPDILVAVRAEIDTTVDRPGHFITVSVSASC
jgi:hypothetical protein